MSGLEFTVQATPNPASMKFVANRPLNEGGMKSFYSAEAASGDPVASKLFALPGVTGVMLLNDFCSVNQDGSRDWRELGREVIDVLQAAYGASD